MEYVQHCFFAAPTQTVWHARTLTDAFSSKMERTMGPFPPSYLYFQHTGESTWILLQIGFRVAGMRDGLWMYGYLIPLPPPIAPPLCNLHF